MKKSATKLSKGPGPVRDGLDKTQHRLYCMAEHCRYAHHARECLRAASGEAGDFADSNADQERSTFFFELNRRLAARDAKGGSNS